MPTLCHWRSKHQKFWSWSMHLFQRTGVKIGVGSHWGPKVIPILFNKSPFCAEGKCGGCVGFHREYQCLTLCVLITPFAFIHLCLCFIILCSTLFVKSGGLGVRSAAMLAPSGLLLLAPLISSNRFWNARHLLCLWCWSRNLVSKSFWSSPSSLADAR